MSTLSHLLATVPCGYLRITWKTGPVFASASAMDFVFLPKIKSGPHQTDIWQLRLTSLASPDRRRGDSGDPALRELHGRPGARRAGAAVEQPGPSGGRRGRQRP